MVSRRNIFKLSVYVLVLCFVVTPALYFPVLAIAPAPETLFLQNEVDEQEAEHPALTIPVEPQKIFVPHWTTKGDFTTTFYIRNVHVEREATAKVSLLIDGQVLPLPPIQIHSLQTIALDAEKVLAEAGKEIEQSGSAIIDFDAESAGAINAYAQLMDTNRSLSFSFPFMNQSNTSVGSLDAVAW